MYMYVCVTAKSVDPTRVGVVIGSAFGGMDSFEKAVNDLSQFGPSAVGPYTIPMILGLRVGIIRSNVNAYSFISSNGWIISSFRKHGGRRGGHGDRGQRAEPGHSNGLCHRDPRPGRGPPTHPQRGR